MSNKQLQKNLKYFKNYYKGNLDGIIGPETKEAIKAFQKDYGLKVDGIFGKNTTAKSIEVIKELQRALNVKVPTNLVIDGLIGDKTIEAIKSFQRQNNLEVDGISGVKTNALLFDEEKAMYPVKTYVQISRSVNSNHNGMDLSATSLARWNSELVENKVLEYDGINHEIVSVLDGTVIKVVKNINYNTYPSGSRILGNYIVIKHNNNTESTYAHLLYNSIKVKVGDSVKKGQTIALMGNTGYSQATHLHFEYKVNGKIVDPIKYLYIYPDQAVGNYIRDNEFDVLYY